MAKEKGIPNKHLHARTTFLYQAATYLTLQAGAGVDAGKNVTDDKSNTKIETGNHNAHALQLASHLRAVSLKGQVRLSADIKRSICKTCNAVLVPGRTATHVVENKSKGGKKPWADVLEVGCNICGSKKRFPVGATRQQRKVGRGNNKDKKTSKKAKSTEPVASTVP